MRAFNEIGRVNEKIWNENVKEKRKVFDTASKRYKVICIWFRNQNIRKWKSIDYEIKICV
jgi:hypothetical protein